MNERNALAIIDRDYGSIEDFALDILSEKRDALDESLPMVKRADIAGLPLTVFARIISSPSFRAILRTELVNTAFGIETESKHIEAVASVAKGDSRLVMNAKGDFGKVDQAPTDIISAGKYLNELRGTPIEKSAGSAPSVIINIGAANKGDADATPTIDVAVESYRPQRAGGLPPAGIRGRPGQAALGSPAPQPTVDDGLRSIYGAGAEEADEDYAFTQKQNGVQGDPLEPAYGQGRRPEGRGRFGRRAIANGRRSPYAESPRHEDAQQPRSVIRVEDSD